MTSHQPERPQEVTVELNGTRHVGSYTVTSGVVKVGYLGASKATQVGNSTPEGIARMLLFELVTEHGATT